MNRLTLERFINKYYLNGTTDAALWQSTDDGLHTNFVSIPTPHLVGSVTAKDLKIEPGEYPVLETGQFLSLIRVLDSDEIDFQVKTDRNTPMGFVLNDKKTKITKRLAHRKAMPLPVEYKNLPPIDVSFALTDDFIQPFLKAKAALPEVTNIVFISDGLKLEAVLGYEENFSTDRVNISIDIPPHKALPPHAYRTESLKAILMANREATKGTLGLSIHGLCHITFDMDGFVLDYYISNMKS